MAGEDDSNRKDDSREPPSSRQWPDDENPFVAFRRFADEQISSMLQSVMGLPSVVTPPRSDHWTIFTDEQNYRDARARQNQDPSGDGKERADSAPNPGASGSDSNDSTTQNTNNNNNIPVGRSNSCWSEVEAPLHGQYRSGRYGAGSSDLFDIDLFFDSFFDRFWFDDYVSSRFFHPYHRGPFANMLSDDSPAWPVPYLMFSPYSPLHLERQAHYHSHRDRGVFSSLMSSLSLSSECDPNEPKWREAFEDLLRLENGKPMLDRDPTAVAKSETGKEWLHSLVKRGSLGDQWKYAAGTDNQPWPTITFNHAPSRSKEDQQRFPSEEEQVDRKTKLHSGADENQSQPEPTTELDMYDRFLSDIETREREFYRGAQGSPLLRFLLEDRHRSRNDTEYPERDHRSDDTEDWLELVSGGQKNSVPDSTEGPTEAAPHHLPEKSPEPLQAEKSYVISTQMSTERVRLSDGSIQTKTVKTKRFSDGREETNESVEVTNPPQRDQDHAGTEGSAGTDQKRNGWFWKD